MPFTLDLSQFDEATQAVLNSEAVQTRLADAFKKAQDEEEKPLRAARDALLSEKKVIEQRLKEYEDLGGLDALKKAKDLEAGVKKKETEVTSKDEQVRQLQEQLNRMQSQAVNEKLSSKLSKEIRDAQGVPELLEGHLKGRIKHELMEDGNLKITVVDPSGAPMFVNGQEASVKDLLSEFKQSPTFARAFDAPQHSGGGSKQAPVLNTSTNPFVKSSLNVTEQSRLIKTDRPRAKQLADAAGVRIEGLNA